MARVFVSRVLPGRAVELLEAAGHEADVWVGDLPPSPLALLAHLRGADGAITLLTDRLDRRVFAAAPGLRVVANMAAGYDNFDVAGADAAGVWLTNTPGVLAATTADFAFALLLAAARRIVEAERDTRAGGWKTWSPAGFLGPEVNGATLGIVGMGEIGYEMARRARGFSMRVLYHSRSAKPVAEEQFGAERRHLHALLAESDFVSLHVSLDEGTRRMIGPAELAAMKRTAIFVNTARGAVVDQEALVAALRSGQIAGAALDVADPEPLPPGHPLFAFPNALITPHMASASVATRSRMAEMAAGNVIAALAGARPPNALNHPRGRA